MSLEWFDKCTIQDFKNGATISAIRDVIKENERLRKIEAAAMKWKAAYEWRFDPDMPEAAPLFPHEDLLAALAGEGGGK